jgi:uncharacterized membrane protein
VKVEMEISEKKQLWLNQEVAQWLQKGIISPDQATKITQLYVLDGNKKTELNLAFVVLSVLGSLSIGLGIILIFAFNWETFGKTTRTILSFLPMLVAQAIYVFTFLRKNQSTAWKEGSSVFLQLMLMSSIALISQTYNLGGSLQDFIFVCMLLSIPLIYFFQSTTVACTYLMGITYWSYSANDSEIWLIFPLVLAVLPQLYHYLFRQVENTRSVLLGWFFGIALLNVSVPFIANANERNSLLFMAMMAIILYLTGKVIYKNGKNMWLRPFQTISIAAILTTSFIFSSEISHLISDQYDNANSILILIPPFLVLVGLVYWIYKTKTVINFALVAVLPIVFFITLVNNSLDKNVPMVLFNVYILVLGVYYLYFGVQEHKLSIINLGMFCISALIILRFFDSDISFVLKGLIFIGLGASFLAINYYLNRKFAVNEPSKING